jgi:hypothetical protein
MTKTQISPEKRQRGSREIIEFAGLSFAKQIRNRKSADVCQGASSIASHQN